MNEISVVEEQFPQEMMTLEELLQRHQKIVDHENELAAEIKRRQNVERLLYRREVITRCEMLGTTPAELFGFLPSPAAPASSPSSSLEKRSKKRMRQPVTTGEPKYRNPDNPDQTWSGRGRRPAWFKDTLAATQPSQDVLLSIGTSATVDDASSVEACVAEVASEVTPERSEGDDG